MQHLKDMKSKRSIREACFIKIGCKLCRNIAQAEYLWFGGKYKTCKDEHLSLKDKIKKLRRYEK